MREESELKGSVDSANQARAIINHPLYIASINTMKELTEKMFRTLDIDDTKKMQECSLRYRLIDEFENNFNTVLSNGDAAFTALEEIAEFKKATE